MPINFNEAAKERKRLEVEQGLKDLAAMSPGGGLYIEDMDCDRCVYSFDGLEITNDGHVRIRASMWAPNELARKTGWFRDR